MVDTENYVHCDDLEKLPPLHAENYTSETDFLVSVLPKKSRVLQIGSMDGTRISRLFEQRSDLNLTGLEIDHSLVVCARSFLKHHKVPAEIIEGDITAPIEVVAKGAYDFVICLNHTLGYIPDQDKAVEMMKQYGKRVVVSVYGEAWTPELAQEYFAVLGLLITEVHDDGFLLDDGSVIHRYSRKEVEKWGGKVLPTPLGYMVFVK